MPDPALYIVAAAVIGSAIGFMACALIVSSRIREAHRDGWISGVRSAREGLDDEPRL